MAPSDRGDHAGEKAMEALMSYPLVDCSGLLLPSRCQSEMKRSQIGTLPHATLLAVMLYDRRHDHNEPRASR
jgi:hypothetical protein